MSTNRNFLIHPYVLGIYLLIASSTVIFVAFSVAYVYNRIHSGLEPIKLPSLFIFNTLVLLASSFTLLKAKKSYLEDNTKAYKAFLSATLILSLLFLILQILAWDQLYASGVLMSQDSMSSFIYAISGVHFFHVIIGIPFLAWFVYKAYKEMREPISVMIYFADETKLRHLKILTIFWHFLDILWLYLVLFLFVNYYL